MNAPLEIRSFSGPYEFLSNFFPAPVTYEGLLYPTSEHAFQAAKTLNPQERERIAAIPKLGRAKRAGRRLQRREDWESIKIDVMEAVLRIKFAPGTPLAKALLATEPAILIEGNTWGDSFWGCDATTGEGRNELGKALMRVRAWLHSLPAPEED